MTLRDYFAGQAVAALARDMKWYPYEGEDPLREPNVVAERAYQCADAMLAARASHVSPRTGDAAE